MIFAPLICVPFIIYSFIFCNQLKAIIFAWQLCSHDNYFLKAIICSPIQGVSSVNLHELPVSHI